MSLHVCWHWLYIFVIPIQPTFVVCLKPRRKAPIHNPISQTQQTLKISSKIRHRRAGRWYNRYYESSCCSPPFYKFRINPNSWQRALAQRTPTYLLQKTLESSSGNDGHSQRRWFKQVLMVFICYLICLIRSWFVSVERGRAHSLYFFVGPHRIGICCYMSPPLKTIEN